MREAQYDYSPEMVLALLPQAYDPLATPKQDEDAPRTRCGDPAVGGNHLAHLADLRRFTDKYPLYRKHSALYWHAHGEPSDLGEFSLRLLVQNLNGG